MRRRIYHAMLRLISAIDACGHDLSMRLIPLRPIGLPFDGKSFNDDTAAQCADRLSWLRAMGYSVPQYAIDTLRDEDADA